MDDSRFEEGCINYTVSRLEIDGLSKLLTSLDKWDDGYAAFSNKEMRIADIKGLALERLLKKVDGLVDGAEGYLMEVGLWKEKDGTVEEVCVEREDRGFFYQRWLLKLKKTCVKEPGDYCCYWRYAGVAVNENSVFLNSNMAAIEVVVPDMRLNFFLSVRGPSQ